jgi:hypothetical protein
VEDIYQNIIGNFIENFNDSTFQLFPRSAIVVSQFFFDIPEEEEVTWCEAWAIWRVWEALGSSRLNTISRRPRIVRTCIVHMDDESFQRLPTRIRREFSHQTWHNSTAEES